MNERQLPLSIQTFEKLRLNQNYVYVDKTPYLYHLVKPDSGVYFLSRPRRFGKSLTVTTLDAIFRGKKELFEGLEISKTDYTWPVHPVIRLDMKLATEPTLKQSEQGILARFKQILEDYQIDYVWAPDMPIATVFNELIRVLHQKTGQKVVVLIDEYDKPLINQFESNNIEKAKEAQKFLKSFYGVLKSADEHLRFVFITGVSKFTKVSIFSDLNHLNDISMNAQYAAICGYTQDELESQFAPWIEKLSKKEGKSKSETVAEIRKWYNGYRLTEAPIYVYNPWSTLYLFNEQVFKNHWFETGTPTFLTKLMKERSFDMSDLQKPVSSASFSSYDIENLELMPLLFQTGYITIKGYEKNRGRYQLDFPNQEVAKSFSELLLTDLTETQHSRTSQIQDALWDALEADDMTTFFDVINTVYANIPYHLHEKKEGYYHSLFIAACQMAGVPVEAEDSSSLGRSDAILKSPTALYIVEFKLNGTADDAIAQIHQKKYMDKYRYIGLPLIAVGVGFDYTQRKITKIKIDAKLND